VYRQTVPELTIWDHWRPGLLSWQLFGLNPDRDPEWGSGSVGNTTDSLSNLASFNDEEDGDDAADDEVDTELGNLSEDDEHSWVMEALSKILPQCIARFRQKHMRIDELTQPGCMDSADSFQDRDMMYGTAGLRVLAYVNPQTDTTTATSSPISYAELNPSLDIVPTQ